MISLCHFPNLRDVTSPSLLVSTKGMFSTMFSLHNIVWFWGFQIYVGVLALNDWLWFSHVFYLWFSYYYGGLNIWLHGNG